MQLLIIKTTLYSLLDLHNYGGTNLIYPTWGLYHSNWVGFNYHKLQP